MIELITDILNYYKHIKKDFDVYVIADTQERTKDLYDCLHADENEFFSREEFAEIASAIFYAFGYVRVFYSEIEFLEYIFQNKLDYNKIIVYNFARDGQVNGKKSLIPAFCDLLNIRYTGSNAFVISLLRNKNVYTPILDINNISVPKSMVIKRKDDYNKLIEIFNRRKIIAKNTHESASIGLTTQNVFDVSDNLPIKLSELFSQMNCAELLVQEYIDGAEFEVLVIQFHGIYYSLMPIELVFPDNLTYIDTKMSNSYQYEFKIPSTEVITSLREAAKKAASLLNIKDYARFDFRVKNGIPYLFDIAGTPYTIHHSSVAYLFTQYYNLPYESIYKVIIACMLSNYDLNN